MWSQFSQAILEIGPSPECIPSFTFSALLSSRAAQISNQSIGFFLKNKAKRSAKELRSDVIIALAKSLQNHLFTVLLTEKQQSFSLLFLRFIE